MKTFTIRKLEPSDYEGWAILFSGYAEYYKFNIEDANIKQTWKWINDFDHPLECLAAFEDHQIIGFSHFRAMPSPLRGENIGFLDDLFVDPEYRGNNLGDMLLSAIQKEAKERGWKIIRWITKDNNYRARSLYDKYSKKTDWNVYEMQI
tara:strand:- start:600 stop:1046 length:447 start_codon:yes stop_codon:yes gene_type:complete